MLVAILILFAGGALVLYGAARYLPPTGLGPIPAAKLEDGSPVSPTGERRSGCAPIALGTMLLVVGGFLAIILSADWGGFLKLGRPFRVRGRPARCRRVRGTGWHDDARPRLDKLAAWQRARLGERWLAAARAEHASVPAFQRLEHQLVAVGAPAALVKRCEAAAADEVRHARRCFAFARAYSGIDWTAGPMPVSADASDAVDELSHDQAHDQSHDQAHDQAHALSSLAIESLVDGCVGEGIAADLAQAGAGRATDPVIAESLAMIANDEAVHAELAWDVVRFCIDRGGPRVAQAVARAARTARPVVSPGPIDLGRAECRQLSATRIARVRERLATVMQAGLSAR